MTHPDWPERLIDLPGDEKWYWFRLDHHRFHAQCLHERRQECRGKRAHGGGKINFLVLTTRETVLGLLRLRHTASRRGSVTLHQAPPTGWPGGAGDAPGPADQRRIDMVQPNTCSGCSATWTGFGTSHCSGCHQTFAGPSLFDLHRTQYGERGTCRRPADMVMTSGARVGEPVMFLREGIWRSPEMTDEQKLARFGRR